MRAADRDGLRVGARRQPRAAAGRAWPRSRATTSATAWRDAMQGRASACVDLYIAIANIMLLLRGCSAWRTCSARCSSGGARHARTDADGGSVFLNKRAMEMAYWLLDPVIDFLAALRITPNMVTLFSLLPAAGAGVAVAFGWFGLASRAGDAGDVLRHPRRPARAQDRACRPTAGEVIDAAVDRYGEFFLLGRPGRSTTGRTGSVLFIVLAAIVGGFMVSYATAKAEAMGVAAAARRDAPRRARRLPDRRRRRSRRSPRPCSRTRRRSRCASCRSSWRSRSSRSSRTSRSCSGSAP